MNCNFSCFKLLLRTCFNDVFCWWCNIMLVDACWTSDSCFLAQNYCRQVLFAWFQKKKGTDCFNFCLFKLQLLNTHDLIWFYAIQFLVFVYHVVRWLGSTNLNTSVVRALFTFSSLIHSLLPESEIFGRNCFSYGHTRYCTNQVRGWLNHL